MRKLLYGVLSLTLCFSLFTGCGNKEETEEKNIKDSTLTTQSEDENEEETTSGDQSTEESVDPDEDNGLAVDEPNTDADKEDDETVDSSSSEDGDDTENTSSVSVFQKEGSLNGFADSHTVEITLTNGKVASYQVTDENVLSALQSYDDGSETTFSFQVSDEDGYATIISVD